MSVALHLDYDFNMPPDEAGLYRVLSHPVVVNHQEPGALIVFGSDGCRAEGIVVGSERGLSGRTLLVVERRGSVQCE